MKRYKRQLNFFLSLLPYLTVFLFALFSPSDPDLGWHLKYGESFFQHGTVLRENTFSTTMPDYQWANTSWLTDVISYAVYAMGGFLGLTLLGALVVTGTFFFFSRAAKLTQWDQAFLFPLLLYVEQPINAVSFRGQQFSLLLIGVLFYLISFYPKKRKILLLTIPLFLLWANLHGQFIFGLAIFAGWMGVFTFQDIVSNFAKRSKKRVIPAKAGIQSFKNAILFYWIPVYTGMTNKRLLGMIFIASALATLLNPFGIGIHTAALSHFGSPLLKNISEYLPFEMLSQPWWNQVIVGIAIGLGVIFLFFKGKLAQQIPLLSVSLVVYILSFGVRRYAWPAYYMIMPMLKPLTGFLKPDGKKTAAVLTTVFLIVLVGIAFVSRYPFTKYIQYNWTDYCKSNAMKCSPEAAEFMIEKKLTKNAYTLYGWGGWLIWEYPEIKPVIDGRMHLWKDASGYSGFIDYYDYEQNMKDINKSSYDTVLMAPDKPVYDRLEELVIQRKWVLVYEDDFAGVFVRNKEK